jgi:Intracellular proteinase inhibitor
MFLLMLLYALNLLGILLGAMTLQIVLPTTVRMGEAVPITLRLTNTSREPVTAYLQGRPVAFDIIVSRHDGTVVWRRLEGAVVSAVLQVRSLAPGEVLEFSDTWLQQSNRGESVGPGEYLVTGVLPTDPPAELRTQPVPLRILP